jgi:hypothetical protein
MGLSILIQGPVRSKCNNLLHAGDGRFEEMTEGNIDTDDHVGVDASLKSIFSLYMLVIRRRLQGVNR